MAKKIVSGNVTRRKKPLGKRFREMFFADAEQSVFDYVFGDVLVPAIKDMISDAVSQGVERMIFGDERKNNRRRPTNNSAFSNPNHVNYTRYSSAQKSSTSARRSRDSHDFEDVILSSREEANEVIGTLIDYVGKYDCATVANLYELIGESTHNTDHKWGWYDLSNAGVRRDASNSYLLVLPKTEAIE